MQPYFEQSLQKLQEFEGSVPWMYRDTAGHITVGVGLLLPDAASAQRLPFQQPGRAATPEEIAADFARVQALPMGRPAQFYHRPGVPELAVTEITALLATVLTGMENRLRAALPAWDTLPDGARMALLDMSYNLGVDGLLHGFPRLVEAVRTGDWAAAASNCARRGPGLERNEWTRRMFLASVIPVLRAEAESTLKRLGFGLVGLLASLFGK